MSSIRVHLPMASALVAIAALSAACLGYDPRNEPDFPDPDVTPPPTPFVTPAPTKAPTPAPTPAPTATPPAPIGSAHVALTVATAHAVTIDVTDSSKTLVAATSGTPGDGATVEAYHVVATNVSPTTLRLTWTGGPCDAANQLLIDAARHQFVVVQHECPGDAIATDRVLDLTFTTPIAAADVKATVQDGLDT